MHDIKLLYDMLQYDIRPLRAPHSTAVRPGDTSAVILRRLNTYSCRGGYCC